MTTESVRSSRLLRPRDVAERLSISRAQVYALITEGVIPGRKIGTCVRVPEWWVEDQTQRPEQGPRERGSDAFAHGGQTMVRGARGGGR